MENLADHIKDVEANIAKIKDKLETLQKKPKGKLGRKYMSKSSSPVTRRSNVTRANLNN
jgi:hypothetical protein